MTAVWTLPGFGLSEDELAALLAIQKREGLPTFEAIIRAALAQYGAAVRERAPRSVTLELRENPVHDEARVFDAIVAKGGLQNHQDVLRVAVWKLALQLKIEMPAYAFVLAYRSAVVEDEQAAQAAEASLPLFGDGLDELLAPNPVERA